MSQSYKRSSLFQKFVNYSKKGFVELACVIKFYVDVPLVPPSFYEKHFKIMNFLSDVDTKL
jgi:hypothetical protein